MKKGGFALLPVCFLFIAMTGCEKEEGKEEKNPLAGIHWKLTKFVDTENSGKSPEPYSNNCYRLYFNADKTLTGMSSTNELFGEYEIELASSSFQIINLGGTEIMETGDGNLFMESLWTIQSFSVANDELRLYYNDKKNYLLFKPAVFCECEGKEIIKVLKDEPAYVVKGCFEYNRVDTFSLELVNEKEEIIDIFPCVEIPKEYQMEGLSVLISGNIMDCMEVNECLMSPYIYLLPTNMFELTDIKRFFSVSNITYSSCDNALPHNEYIRHYAVNDSTLGVEHKLMANCAFESCDIKLGYEKGETIVDLYDYGNESNCLCPVIIRYEIRNLEKNNTYPFIFKRHALELHQCEITFASNTDETIDL